MDQALQKHRVGSKYPTNKPAVMDLGKAKDLYTVEKMSPQEPPEQRNTFSLPYLPARSSALQKWTEEIPGYVRQKTIFAASTMADSPQDEGHHSRGP